jgi:hypothetical protein
MVCTVVRSGVERIQAAHLVGNRSSSYHPVGMVSGPLDLAVGTVAYLCLQAREPHMKMPSQCCRDTHGRRSSTVAPAGSHICQADLQWRVVRALWKFADWDLANENDFWILSVLEAYDRSGGETW